ncbi:MAG: dienelactone hydrolase family protein [Moraxellaceae bacterium]|nr:dienelactone hydrolase family protein [Moraxellaceae bacterium]
MNARTLPLLARLCMTWAGLAAMSAGAADAGPAATGTTPGARLGFEQIEFDSLDTTGLFPPKPVKISGYLLKSTTPGKAPAAVLAPACNGLLSPGGDLILPHYRNMAKMLNEMGLAVLLVDGFNPRGFKEICTQPARGRDIDTATRMKDSLGALAYLRTRSDVSPEQIVLLSWGAAGSFQAMAAEPSRADKAGGSFKAAVMFYPDCSSVSGRYTHAAPIQVLVGDKDTWNPPAACQTLTAQRSPGSAAFELKVYPGAFHGFDQPRAPSLRTDTPFGPVMTGGNPEAAADANKVTASFLAPFVQPAKAP